MASSGNAAKPQGHQVTSTMILVPVCLRPAGSGLCQTLLPRSEHTMLPLFMETSCGAGAQQLLAQARINCLPARLQPRRLGFSKAGRKEGNGPLSQAPEFLGPGEDGTEEMICWKGGLPNNLSQFQKVGPRGPPGPQGPPGKPGKDGIDVSWARNGKGTLRLLAL